MHKPVTARSRRGPPPNGESDLDRLDEKAKRLGPMVPLALTKIIMKEMSEQKLPNLPTLLVTHVGYLG